MTTRTTLTDRYVWTVTRHLPSDTGPDVAQELRATIADAIDGKVDGGSDVESAEQDVLTELGDPEALARQYGGRPSYLIGPAIYPDYLKLIRLLPPIVLPIVLVANLVARLAADGDAGWGSAILDSCFVVLSVAVHLGFWVTLTFALIEWNRPEGERDRPLSEWKPDQLTAQVPWRSVGLGETIFQVSCSLLVAGLVAWQFSGVGSHALQILNPEVDVVWKVSLVALFLFDVVVAVAVWRAGRWTPTLAAVNVASNAAVATLLLWLLSRGELLTDLPEVFGAKFGWSTNWSVPTSVVAVGIVLVTVWDGLESVLKARRSMKGHPVR